MNRRAGQGTAHTWLRQYHVKTPAAMTGWWLNWRSASLIMRKSVDQEPRFHKCSVLTVMVSRNLKHLTPKNLFVIPVQPETKLFLFYVGKWIAHLALFSRVVISRSTPSLSLPAPLPLSFFSLCLPSPLTVIFNSYQGGPPLPQMIRSYKRKGTGIENLWTKKKIHKLHSYTAEASCEESVWG